MDHQENVGQLLEVRWMCAAGVSGASGISGTYWYRCLFRWEKAGQLLEVGLHRAGNSVASGVSLCARLWSLWSVVSLCRAGVSGSTGVSLSDGLGCLDPLVSLG